MVKATAIFLITLGLSVPTLGQLSLTPTIGANWDWFDVDSKSIPISISDRWSGIYPSCGMKLDYGFSDIIGVGFQTIFAVNNRQTSSRFLADPIVETKYSYFNVGFNIIYHTPIRLSGSFGVGLQRINNYEVKQLYSGWNATHFSASNILGFNFSIDYSYKCWVLGLSSFLPIKKYNSTSLIDKITVFGIHIGYSLYLTNHVN